MFVRVPSFARWALVVAIGFALSPASVLAQDAVKADASPAIAKEPTKDGEQPVIQIAILLDTSSSMSGLINQARSQLWKVVNEYALAKRDGKSPRVKVAVYEYGNSRLDREGGFIRMVSKLTDDLDSVSEGLFKLTTSGGSEHCGQVIDRAVTDLDWTDDEAALKCIFIAGNERFTQGPVDYRKACQKAIEKGITVNTIHCGTHSVGVSGKWQEGALLADGSFVNINQNEQVVDIPTPHDKELVRLSGELNTTYIAWGSKKKREDSVARQSAQDANAAGSSIGSAASRANSKALAIYNNASWDLVDACKQGKIKIEDLKKEELPEELRKMSTEELKKFVAKNEEKRTSIQEKIKSLNKQRQDFIAKERKKLAGGKKNTLDEAMIATVRSQAEKKKYVFEK